MKTKYKRRFVTVLLSLFVLSIIWLAWQAHTRPSRNIRILEGHTHYVNYHFPFLYVQADRDDILLLNGNPLPAEASRIQPPFNLEALEQGSVNLELSLFGVIPISKITIDVLPEVRLVPGGHSIGVKLYSQGVNVVGYYYFETVSGSRSPAREAGVRTGDTILSVNGTPVSSINKMVELLAEAADNRVTLLIERDGREMEISIQPLYSKNDRDYRIGIYIRDSAAGVGTLSFYDPESLRYGALGHVIIDADTNKPVNLCDGTIVKARIIDIKSARKGQPGEKSGVFLDSKNFSGTIDKNSPFGIFGKLKEIHPVLSPYPEPLPMALAGQVKTGPAEMLTVIDGETIRSFKVEITRINPQQRPSDKGMVVQIVDEELLELTGGIIQGMSGSPLIQNGRLIGAITHVFINDPTQGYAIFMEWMYQEAEILTNE